MRFRRRYTLYPVKTKKGKRIWYFRVYIDGRRKARTTGCTSKEKAIMYVETLLCEPNRLKKLFGCSLSMELESGTSSQQSASQTDITFGEYARNWWLWDKCPYVIARREAGSKEHPGIKQSYVTTGRQWTTHYLMLYFGTFNLIDINSEMITHFLRILKSKHGLAPKTINNIRSIMMIMMEEAVKKEMIGLNPVKGTVSRCVDAVKRELLTDEECSRLFAYNAINEIWKGKLCYYGYNLVANLTGMRAGEIIALTIDDISEHEIRVNKSYSEKFGMGTTKTSKKRDIPITAGIYRLLLSIYHSNPHNDSRFIFTVSDSKPMDSRNGRKALYAALQKIGISKQEIKDRNITFHSWRHKFVTDCVNAGMHPEKIKMLTGHSTSSMISHYTDLNPQKDISKEINEIQRSKCNKL